MNPSVTMVEVSVDDVVAGLKARLLVWAASGAKGVVSDWAGQPYRYDRATGKVSWVPSGAVTAETWAAAIIQSPATAMTRTLPIRAALGLE